MTIHEYQLIMNEGGPLSVKIDKDAFGVATMIAFVSAQTIITLTRPHLVATHVTRNVAQLTFQCKVDGRAVQVNLHITGDDTALVKTANHLFNHMVERVYAGGNVKTKPRSRTKVFSFDEVEPFLAFRDSSLAALFQI